jgi:hypothetical protein
MRQLTHWIASVAFVATLCLPLLQTATGALPNAGLGGVVKPLAPLDPSLAAWNEGSLQHAIEDRVRRNLGLRDWMIRADNELRMQAFVSAKRPILANEDGWLLEEGYLPTKILARESGIVDELLTRACNLRRLQDVRIQRGLRTHAFSEARGGLVKGWVGGGFGVHGSYSRGRLDMRAALSLRRSIPRTVMMPKTITVVAKDSSGTTTCQFS